MDLPLYPISNKIIGDRFPIVPVIKHDNKQCFMSGSECIEDVNVFGTLISTAPLKPGTSIDLDSNSNIINLINKGFIDAAFALSPNSSIKYIYVEVGGSIMKFDMDCVKTAQAVPVLTGDTRVMRYDLTVDFLHIGKKSLDYLGTPFNYHHVLGQFDTELVLRLSLTGTIDPVGMRCKFGTGNAYIGHTVSSKVDSEVVNKQYIDPLIKAVIGECNIVGFELDLSIDSLMTDPARLKAI
mgnify:CR=1 FL=1